MNISINLHIRKDTSIEVKKAIDSPYRWLEIDNVNVHIKREDIDRLKEKLNQLYNEMVD